MHGLSDAELCNLDNFLANESVESTSMDLAMLDGYLTAIAIGPGLIPRPHGCHGYGTMSMAGPGPRSTRTRMRTASSRC